MKLVCLGANNPEAIRIARAIGRTDPGFELLGFVDNDESRWGRDFYGYPVFGGMNVVASLSSKGALFCNLITRDCQTRYETTLDLVRAGGRLANIVYPDVNLAMVTLGLGDYVHEGVIIEAMCTLGDNSAIGMGALIGHESQVGDSVFIAHGCALSGKVTVEDGVFVGAGATVLPRLTIGRWSVIGAGTVVIEDVPPYSVVVGNPGRLIKETGVEHVDGRVLQ